MFDIGFSELMIIGVVALIVLGPERLPKVARTAGQWLGKAQRYVNDVKADIARESELAELKKLKAEMETAATEAKQSIESVATTVNQEVKAAEQSVTQSYTALADDPKSITQMAGAASTPATDTAAAIEAAAGPPLPALEPDPFAPLPEVASYQDPAHDVGAQRQEADRLINEIAKLEERLAQLKRNAETARNMAA
jgi:sec-independent protein translocase protein TatB